MQLHKAQESANAPHNQEFHKPKTSKPHPKQAHLDGRVKSFEGRDTKTCSGYIRPGSYKK